MSGYRWVQGRVRIFIPTSHRCCTTEVIFAGKYGFYRAWQITVVIGYYTRYINDNGNSLLNVEYILKHKVTFAVTIGIYRI